jgi:hypothetical protein
MKTKKILLGGIAGGITFFLLGWVVYGMLLMDYNSANTNQTVNRPMEEMVFWAMLLSNLALGFLVSFGFNWSNSSGLMAGLRIGGIIGLLVSLSIDLSFYAMTTMFPSITPLIVDVLVYTALTAVTGSVVALVAGMVKK